MAKFLAPNIFLQLTTECETRITSMTDYTARKARTAFVNIDTDREISVSGRKSGLHPRHLAFQSQKGEAKQQGTP